MSGRRWRKIGKPVFYRCAGARRVSGLLCPVFREKGVTINKAPGDDEILKTPSILSLSAITPRAAPRRRERQQQQCGERGEIAA